MPAKPRKQTKKGNVAPPPPTPFQLETMMTYYKVTSNENLVKLTGLTLPQVVELRDQFVQQLLPATELTGHRRPDGTTLGVHSANEASTQATDLNRASWRVSRVDVDRAIAEGDMVRAAELRRRLYDQVESDKALEFRLNADRWHRLD